MTPEEEEKAMGLASLAQRAGDILIGKGLRAKVLTKEEKFEAWRKAIMNELETTVLDAANGGADHVELGCVNQWYVKTGPIDRDGKPVYGLYEGVTELMDELENLNLRPHIVVKNPIFDDEYDMLTVRW